MKRKAWLVAILLSTLTGCASVTNVPLHDPDYAPVAPPAPTEQQTNRGAIYQPDRTMVLFEDVKARNVGDLLTIVLMEKTNASKSASTTASKDQGVDLGAASLFGRPVLSGGVNPLSASVDANRDFKGEGGSSQSNQLTGQITVTVAQVLANGNLVVRGEKVLSLNQGDEFIRFSGIVRPADITSANTVASTHVANAQIIYGGRGVVAESNQMGWLSRFFHSVLWPF